MARGVLAWGVDGAAAVLFAIGLTCIHAMMAFEQKCPLCGRNLDGLESGTHAPGSGGRCHFCAWKITPLRTGSR
ncbi:hypothetical protein CVV65_05365 [Kyrpidia spormannii]|uniref:Uncharacterized protein n=2 Tax=Kyrpidia spormannii TaxID=2055160 RepID=A0A2K8N533_9BACL|nr:MULTISPECIES: hypothetical protein [Kyrpidia]ATY84454.1 hypothetical protein CVV65_05365 [Kyrpidia spormannii]MCL6577133.1 hypothetical protein [Kyrpidia sp.]CAB3391248.1 conserved protein of unknown function [Kyrpidia spormannii]CAB3392159.1 conserved protein of unknown function [Kyrpidia spormannii]